MQLSQLKLTDKRKNICERLELNDSNDILSYYPFKYEEYKITHIDEFKEGSEVFFEGELLTSPSTFRYQGRKSVTRFKVLYEGEEFLITIFNRPWARNIPINSKITIIGKYEGSNKIVASNYYLKPINELEGIIPYYSLKEGINQNEIRKLIEFTIDKCDEELIDLLPSSLIKKHNLIDYKTALYNIHFPKDKEILKKALSRLKYEEFIRFYLSLEYLKDNKQDNDKKAKVFDENKVNQFIKSFSYELTIDQNKTKDDVLNDLKSNKTMYRLVQGEVGSGKTAIAMIGLYANFLAGYQGALMAPTEILAKQHYKSFIEQFKGLNINIGLLYSGSEDLKETKKKILNGEIDIIIGTHSLFQEDVIYHNLGLVIADEQHRFGVKQRRALKQKGENVDFMLMSATPIPRTLASTLYGDNDISTIESLPLNRKGCKTYLIKKNSIVDILDDLKIKLNEGRQIYIIAAAIEASENYNAKDASGLYASLIGALKPYKVGLLHGKMTALEKDLVMERFNNNDIQVLVSTTVVEVGVNVKNATCMVVYDADKFGLSQLHQLRGRVQRGEYEGSCYLLTSSKDESIFKRLNVLVDTNDGFKISLEDLKLRGPGDLLGTRQSGLPAFILGNILEDTKFIEAAKKDAKEIIENLEDPENKQYFEKIAQSANQRAID